MLFIVRFARQFAGAADSRSAVHGSLVFVALGFAADGVRRIVLGKPPAVDDAVLGAIVASLQIATIGVFVAATRRATGTTRRAGVLFVLSASSLLLPTVTNVAMNLGLRFPLYGLLRDVCLLAFIFGSLSAYLDQPSEKTSIRDRLTVGTLTVVLGSVNLAWEAVHPSLGAAELRAALPRVAAVLVLATALVLLGSRAFYQRSFADPVARLVEGVTRLEAGESEARVIVTASDEIGFLTGAVNKMADAIDAGRRDLARQLAATQAKNLEVEGLNGELRRQIIARSRDLASTLQGSAGPARFADGDVVEGEYRVRGLLGEGGMGAVYEVERIRDGRRLALKVMSGSTSRDEVARFAREAQIAAELDHPNLVGVVDVGVCRGAAFIVMQLVRDGSLQDARERFGDVDWALPLLGSIAEALAHLHAKGIVHGDLKPANVLMDGATPKITDFGISRRDANDALAATMPAASPGGSLTATGILMGTFPYMAPELARGARNATAAADVFAFGVMAHEMLSGAYPFRGPPVLDAMAGRSIGVPPHLERVDAAVSDILASTLDARVAARPTASAIGELLLRRVR